MLQVNYFPALDGLRGIAILMVIFSHFGLNHFLRPYHVLVDSDIGVHIFFVLSGFLITTLLIKEKIKTGKISLKHFYLRRALRILPVAYLFLIILIALNSWYKLQIPVLNFIASFLFFKNLPLQNEPYTAHFWSLAIEEQFYLTFPFLLTISLNSYFITALSIVIVVPVVSILGYYDAAFLNAAPWVHWVVKIIMYSFWKGPVIILIGSVFSIFLFKGIIKVEKVNTSYFLSFVLLSIAILISSKTFVFYCKYLSEYLSAILVGFVILLILNRKSFLSAILSNTILIKVGILSYSLYIWQQLFIGVHPWQPWTMFLKGYPVGVLIAIKLTLLFLIASISYYFVESKFLRIKARYY